MWQLKALWQLLTQPLSDSLYFVAKFEEMNDIRLAYMGLCDERYHRIRTLEDAIEEYKRRLDRAHERMNELSNTRIPLSKPDVHKPEDRQVRKNWEGR